MNKSSNLRIRVEPRLHHEFLDVCKAKDVPAAQVLREFMKDYVKRSGRTAQRDFFGTEQNSDPIEAE